MPDIFEDIIRPNGGPSLITGYDPLDAADFLEIMSDDNDSTFVSQTADSNEFRSLQFEDVPSGGIAQFSSAQSIDEIIFNIRCRCLDNPMTMEYEIQDNLGVYPTVINFIEERTFTTLQTTLTTDTASDPIDTSTIKGLQLRNFTAAGQGGGTGTQFRLLISDIFVTVISSNRLPTQTITLNSGLITLDLGKITVQ